MSFRGTVNASPSPFQSNDFETFLINVICVLLMYGSAYLANTGAMLFGKWIPEKTGFPVAIIDGGRNYSDGNRILGDGKPKNGAHNKPVIFLHPKDFFGTLIELEQE